MRNVFPKQICSNTAVCENTEGSYRCNCKKGFKHKADGLACEGKDDYFF